MLKQSIGVAGPFDGVKVFSATLFADRGRLGETVTTWIEAHPEYSIVEIAVRQSSDSAYHCLTIAVFYAEQRARQVA